MPYIDDLPPAPLAVAPHHLGHTAGYHRAQPADRRANSVIDAPAGGHRAPFFAHPPDRRARSTVDAPRRRWPLFHARQPDRFAGYGIYDPRDHWPPPSRGRPLDHRAGYCIRTPSGLWALNPPPPTDRYGVDTPRDVSAPLLPSPPDRHASPGTSDRPQRRSTSRNLRPRRGADTWHAPYHRPSPPIQSSHREHRHRARDERSRSPRLHSLLSGSTSPPSSKRSRLEDGRKGSSSGGHMYEDERGGGRGRYGADWHTAERLRPSSGDHRHGHRKRSFSPPHHSLSRRPPLSASIVVPPLDDCCKSPPSRLDSPIYCYKHELDIGRGGHGDDGDENCAPDRAGSAIGANDGSGITCREPNFNYEGPSYDALANDFMDAVVDNWRETTNFDPAENEEAYQKQTKRFAELALKRYNKNKNNKIKYSLVEAIDGAVIFEGSEFYAHVNFYANAKNGLKKNGPKVLVFAELHHVGRRPNAMVLTSFHLLDEKKQFSGRCDQVQSSHTTEDRDMYHCYACDGKIKHPEGSCYRAGHFVDISYCND